MSAKWPEVRIGEITDVVNRPLCPAPGELYRQIGVRLWGEGAYEREPLDGADTKYRILNRVQAGDIIVNKIWARNGSVSVVPPTLAGCVCSGEFPLFTARPGLLDPRWFFWITKARWFWERCDFQSRGTSGKNRIRPENFLQISIPLPPYSHQRRIVAKIEQLAAKVEEATQRHNQSLACTRAFMSSARRRAFGLSPGRGWVPLSRYIAAIENGKSPAAEGRPAALDEWGVLKVGAVSFGVFDEAENKALPPFFAPAIECEVKVGDFLMSRANTFDLVGACAVVRNTRPHLMLSDKIFRFVFKQPADINLEYLDHLLKSPPLREQIVRVATGTSPTMKNISKEKVLSLLVPSHSRCEQDRIAVKLSSLLAQVGQLEKYQAAIATMLGTMMPAILDRAFKGEL